MPPPKSALIGNDLPQRISSLETDASFSPSCTTLRMIASCWAREVLEKRDKSCSLGNISLLRVTHTLSSLSQRFRPDVHLFVHLSAKRGQTSLPIMGEVLCQMGESVGHLLDSVLSRKRNDEVEIVFYPFDC